MFDVWSSGQCFAYVVTVCSEVEAQGCPIFQGMTTRLHWPSRNPSQLTEADAVKLEEVRNLRDEIRTEIEELCEAVCPETLGPSTASLGD